jgi:membrane associated rhomboid family serine protease
VFLSLVTCMFLHAGWLHLVGNMWFFWLFGNNIEDRIGRLLFPLFYLLGGVFATVCHWMVSAGAELIPIVGASGAVAVMLGAYLVTYPTARVKTLVFIVIFITVIELPAGVVLAVWLLLQLLDGVKAFHLGIDGGVAWWAHIGGFAFGMLLMPLLAAGTAGGDADWRFTESPQRDYLDSPRNVLDMPESQSPPTRRSW